MFSYFFPVQAMEKHWLKSIEDGLKKERDPRIKRSFDILEENIPEDVFMRNRLDRMNEMGKGRFLYIYIKKDQMSFSGGVIDPTMQPDRQQEIQ